RRAARDRAQARNRAKLAPDARGRGHEPRGVVAGQRDFDSVAAAALKLKPRARNVAHYLARLALERLLRAARAVRVVDVNRERAAGHGSSRPGAAAAAVAALRADRGVSACGLRQRGEP